MTERGFEAVVRTKPRQLLVNADGPRHDVPGEADKCRANRAIIDRVVWNYELITNYSDVALGCSACVARGIDWIFIGNSAPNL